MRTRILLPLVSFILIFINSYYFLFRDEIQQTIAHQKVINFITSSAQITLVEDDGCEEVEVLEDEETNGYNNFFSWGGDEPQQRDDLILEAEVVGLLLRIIIHDY